MAKEEQTEQPQDDMLQENAPAKKSNKMVLIAAIAGAVVLLEGVGIFVAVKMVSKGPEQAIAEELQTDNKKESIADLSHEETREVKIADLECPHTNTGRLYVIEMTVYATVPKSLLEPKNAKGEEGHGEGKDATAEPTGVAAEIKDNIATIKDRMRTVVASADTSTLCLARSEKPDYGLSTLRRQFKTILDDVLGKNKIKKVLISNYMPRPMD